MKLEKLIRGINLPYHIAHHVVGEKHTVNHRRIAGVIVMFIGVTLAHTAAHVGNLIIALTGDLIGYSIHATGFLPFLHDIENSLTKGKQVEEETKCETC